MPAKFEPTPEQRLTVKLHKIAGTPTATIARLITNPKTGAPITEKTMLKTFRDELDLGKSEVDALCVGKVVQAMKNGEAWAVCFYAKTQMGWSEKQRVEHSGSLDVKTEADEAKRKLAERLTAGSSGSVAE